MFGKSFAMALLVLTFSLIGFSQSERQVRIPKGTSTINFKSYVKDTRKTYHLNLRPGQKVDLSITSKTGNVVFDAYFYPAGEEMGTPLVTETKEWTGTLPKATKYTVDVFTTDNVMSSYRFTVHVVKN